MPVIYGMLVRGGVAQVQLHWDPDPRGGLTAHIANYPGWQPGWTYEVSVCKDADGKRVAGPVRATPPHNSGDSADEVPEKELQWIHQQVTNLATGRLDMGAAMVALEQTHRARDRNPHARRAAVAVYQQLADAYGEEVGQVLSRVYGMYKRDCSDKHCFNKGCDDHIVGHSATIGKWLADARAHGIIPANDPQKEIRHWGWEPPPLREGPYEGCVLELRVTRPAASSALLGVAAVLIE